MRKVLIVVDMQNDFVTGSLGSEAAKDIVPNIRKKIDEYVKAGHDVIFTRDTHFGDYMNTMEGKKLPVPHCIYGAEGWKVIPELDTPNCKYIDKYTFGWEHWNEKVYDEYELVGVCTDICVVSNALAVKMFFPDAVIKVDASCCAGVTEETHKAALTTMKCCHIDVIGE